MRQWKICTPSFDIHSEGARLKLPLERLAGRSLEGVKFGTSRGMEYRFPPLLLFRGLFQHENVRKTSKI